MKIRRSLLAALSLVAVLATPSFAKDLQGTWGLGYFRAEAPVGARIWVSNNVGIDAGLGFTSTDYGDLSLNGESTSAFTLDIGVPVVVANLDNTIFFVRPGVLYNSTTFEFDNGVGGTDEVSPTTLWISGSLGVEHFFGDRFSLSAAHGIYYATLDPDAAGLDNFTEFGTEEFGVSNIGFHFYFGGAK